MQWTKIAKGIGRLVIALILLSPLAVVDLSHAAGRVFYDGFEDGTTNKWSQDDNRNRCTVVASANDGVLGPYAGTRMASCNSNGAVAWDTPAAFENLVLNGASYTNELFYRVWFRMDSVDFDRTTGSPKKLIRIYHADGQTPHYNDVYDVPYGSPGLANAIDGAGGVQLGNYWGGAAGDNTSSDTAHWHKVEYWIKISTGQIRVWHDGIMVRDVSGLPTGNAPWYPFYITSNWSDPHDATNHLYFDEVEVFSDTGSGATGLMSDATIQASGGGGSPPSNAPQNLTVQ